MGLARVGFVAIICRLGSRSPPKHLRRVNRHRRRRVVVRQAGFRARVALVSTCVRALARDMVASVD